MPSMEGAFYTVADARHFVGAVALLNSLRLVGHDEAFVIVDAGLDDWQRALIAPHAELVAAADGLPPMMLKQAGPLERPADVMAVLDADVIVTRNLAPAMERAAAGGVVVFGNDNPDRFFPEWGELLGLPGPLRRQPYVASGHLFVGGESGRALLRRLDDAQRRLDLSQTLLANTGAVMRCTPADPFYFPDMDVLNALLCTVVAPADLTVLDYRLAPHAPFRGLELVDEHSLRCAWPDGVEPHVLHHVLRKPWLATTPPNVYSRLLPRVLLGDDVAVRMDPGRLPLRLRTGALAGVERRRAAAQATLHSRFRGKLGLRPRLHRLVASATAARRPADAAAGSSTR